MDLGGELKREKEERERGKKNGTLGGSITNWGIILRQLTG